MRLSPQYMAGLFDGEGSVCVDIRRMTRSACLRICICNRHQGILADVKETTGYGFITKVSGKRSKCGVWIAVSIQAARFLEIVRPYLVIKSDQADLAIEFQSITKRHGRTKLDPAIALRKEQIRREIQACNARYNDKSLRNLKKGLNSADLPEMGTTPSQQDGFRKAVRACVTVSGE
jgi:hypothetical protein